MSERGFRRLLRIRPGPADVEEELGFHIESRIHDLTRGGAVTMDAVPVGSTWSASGALPLAGPWEVSVDVRIDTFTQETGSCSLRIAG